MRTLLGLATATLVIQTSHHLEHIAQVMQIYLLHSHPAHARGLLGAHFDFEWVHFAYNWGLEALILIMAIYARRSGAWAQLSRPARWTLVGLAAFQGYHALEHGVKMYQYLFVEWYRFGFHTPPGLLPEWIDQPIFLVHFWLNMGVWTLIVLLWWLLGPARLRAILVDAAIRLRQPSTRLRVAGVMMSLGVLAWGATWTVREVATTRVPAERESLQAAVDAALPGGTVLVAPGIYESVSINKPLILRAEVPGTAVITGEDDRPLIGIYRTHNVAVEGFVLQGGRIGILVEGAELVRLRDNRISEPWWAGIRLSSASAEIEGNIIESSRSPYGMGIELANTHSRSPSRIAYNIISHHPAAGIDMHNADAEIVGNLVTENGLRGIAVTEMSTASVRNNTLLNNADAGLYIVDMSVVEATGNQVRGTRPGGLLGRADAIRLQYYAEALLADNRLEPGLTGEVVVLSGSTVEFASVREAVSS